MSNLENHLNLDDEIVIVYTQETMEQLLRLAVILRDLQVDQSKQEEYSEEMYRLVHTIKGSSEIVGVEPIGKIMLEVEKLFASVNEGRRQLVLSEISTLLELTFELSSYIEHTFTSEFAEEEWLRQIKRLSTASDQPDPTVEVSLGGQEPSPFPIGEEEETLLRTDMRLEEEKITYRVVLSFSNEAQLRSATAVAFLNFVKRFGEIKEIEPSYEELLAENYQVFRIILLREKALTEKEETRIKTAPANEGVLGVVISRLDKQETKIVTKEESSLEDDSMIEQEVKSDQYMSLIETLGKLTTVQEDMLWLYRRGENTLSDWEQLGLYLQTLEGVNSDLWNETLKLRLLPVGLLFSKVSSALGKEVNVEFLGAETEVTREVADKLLQPLLVLTRFILSEQGIKDVDGEREQRGVILEAEREGEFITISIERAEGLDYSNLSGDNNFLDTEVLNEIEEIIRKLQGELYFYGDHRGIISLKLPVITNLTRACIFRAGTRRYMLPNYQFNHEITIKKKEIQQSGGILFYLRYPEVIPLFDLEGILDSYDKNSDISVLIVSYDRLKFGLVINELLGFQEVFVIREENLEATQYVSGVGRLKDGNTVYIPDLCSIAQQNWEL